MSGEEIAAAAEVKAVLMIPHKDTGYQLPESTCELLASHIVIKEHLKVDSVNFDRPNELWLTLQDAWNAKYGEEAPRSYEARIRSWAIGDAAAAAAMGGGGGGGLVSTSVSGGTFESSEHVAAARAEVKKLGEAVDAERVEAVTEALAAQRFTTGAQLTQFAFSLQMGRVVPSTQLKGVTVGEDPALSNLEMFKVARKASRKTLSTIIASKDGKALRSFFLSAQRDFSAKNYSHEASLVSEFVTQTLEVYGSSEALLFEYLEAYFEKHVGLGLPVPLDQPLVVRLIGGHQSGASKADIAEVKAEASKKVSKMEARFEAMEARQKKLEAENSRLSSLVKKYELADDGDKPAKEKKKKGKKPACFRCGSTEHLIDECPLMAEEKEE